MEKKKNKWPHLSPRMQPHPRPHQPYIRESELAQRSYGDSSTLRYFVPKSLNLSVTFASHWPLKYQWTQTHRDMSSSSQQTVHARDGAWCPCTWQAQLVHGSRWGPAGKSPSPLCYDQCKWHMWKTLWALPARFRKSIDRSPTSIMRLTVKIGAQNVGKERATVLPEQDTGLKAKWASPVAQMVKNWPTMREIQVWSLGWEDPLEKGMATHSSILAWRIPWAEEPGESMRLQRVRPDWATNTFTFFHSGEATGKEGTNRECQFLWC